MLATPPSCASPGVSLKDSLLLPKSHLKRKRSPSDAQSHIATKVRHDPVDCHSNRPVAPPSPSSQGSVCHSHTSSSAIAPVASSRKVDNTDKLRDTLQGQLSLEVLLKHNELRFVDQEIAKCQIALEQLRRCSEIPYPGSQVAGVSPALSNGSGVAVCPPGNGPVPLSPAPWGVTDGPYSRHYARWLLPDPRFDGGHLETRSPWATTPTVNIASANPVEGRSTRANPGDNGALANKSRPQRGSISNTRLQALPNGYPAPKERAGPMIIRRKSDGVMVKLVCLDCRRDNFSSTQGFINHCRIAHNRNFASHDAAAVASGEPVKVDEAGVVVGGSKTETSNGPPAPPGYVHPLVRSAHVIEPQSTTPAAAAATQNAVTPRNLPESGRRSSFSMAETPRNPVGPSHKRHASSIASSSCLASPDTPHLSSLMQHHGAGVDLDQLVGEAKDTFDLGAYSSANEDESEDDEPAPPAASNATPEVRTGRQPVRTVGTSQQPNRNTRKPQPLESLTMKPGPSHVTPYEVASTADQVDGMEVANLSPNTVESNQAPSLVSDDDDDDDGEAASDSESPGPTSSDAGDDADREFSYIDVEDDDAATESAAATAEPKGGHGPPGLSPTAPLSKSLRRGHSRSQKKDRFIPSPTTTLDGDQEEKHVSFVGPETSPDTSPSKGKKTGHRK